MRRSRKQLLTTLERQAGKSLSVAALWMLLAGFAFTADVHRKRHSAPAPPSGFRFETPEIADNRGSITVSNQLGHNTILFLLDGQGTYTWFVERDSTVQLDDIADGSYRVFFCSGDGWHEDRSGINGHWFQQDNGCNALEDRSAFRTQKTQDGWNYTRAAITLYETAGAIPASQPLTKRAVLDRRRLGLQPSEAQNRDAGKGGAIYR